MTLVHVMTERPKVWASGNGCLFSPVSSLLQKILESTQDFCLLWCAPNHMNSAAFPGGTTHHNTGSWSCPWHCQTTSMLPCSFHILSFLCTACFVYCILYIFPAPCILLQDVLPQSTCRWILLLTSFHFRFGGVPSGRGMQQMHNKHSFHGICFDCVDYMKQL